jgi:hypothetical protein
MNKIIKLLLTLEDIFPFTYQVYCCLMAFAIFSATLTEMVERNKGIFISRKIQEKSISICQI